MSKGVLFWPEWKENLEIAGFNPHTDGYHYFFWHY